MRQVHEGADNINFIANDVLSWVNNDDGLTFSHVLFKEMIHHVPTDEFDEIFVKVGIF